MGCWCSPYTFLGHKGILWSCWGHCGKLTIEDVVHSGGVQLGQGAVVPEVAGFVLVKAFSVPMEAHWEKGFLEDLVL